MQSASTSGGASCAATVPTRTVKPDAGFGRNGFNFGTGSLRVHLNWSDGVLRAGTLADGGSMATINRDGTVRTKVGWWVGSANKLVIAGRRLDRAATPLQASIPSGYGLGFQPTALTFPTVGCWRVVGKAGTARLTFVVKVTKLK